MSNEQEAPEKDYFFYYIAIGVIIFASVIFMVKNAESGKFEKAKSLIAENVNNSAYKVK
ncbi:MAG: hypothetical protein IBX55_11045 [Methyloprofundus sp.]|nr:hypothetical protein [Methyloprofundus sp.]MBW6453812.1 hypothetical protein [Methyloprofundus sp.]